jgi:hypothetical protein
VGSDEAGAAGQAEELRILSAAFKITKTLAHG